MALLKKLKLDEPSLPCGAGNMRDIHKDSHGEQGVHKRACDERRVHKEAGGADDNAPGRRRDKELELQRRHKEEERDKGLRPGLGRQRGLRGHARDRRNVQSGYCVRNLDS